MEINQVALLIVYNHRFDNNIEPLNELYKRKFSYIYHLIPFYNGKLENVLPVYESSYNFSGYISQAKTQLDAKGIKFNHYFVIADDMVLNPIITEKNYSYIFNLDATSSFLPYYINVTKENFYNWRGMDCLRYTTKVPGVEVENILPTYSMAMALLQRHGIEVGNWKWYHFIPHFKHFDKYLKWHIKKVVQILYGRRNLRLLYPTVGGYSDIVIISSLSIEDFCLYAGCFAATNLFVEFAIPTALLLSSEHVIFEKDLDMRGRALWTKEDFKILNKYNNSLQALLNDFPSDYLYLHPIKLSKWK